MGLPISGKPALISQICPSPAIRCSYVKGVKLCDLCTWSVALSVWTHNSEYSHNDYIRPWVHENKHLSHPFRAWFSKARAYLHLSTFKENILSVLCFCRIDLLLRCCLTSLWDVTNTGGMLRPLPSTPAVRGGFQCCFFVFYKDRAAIYSVSYNTQGDNNEGLNMCIPIYKIMVKINVEMKRNWNQWPEKQVILQT